MIGVIYKEEAEKCDELDNDVVRLSTIDSNASIPQHETRKRARHNKFMDTDIVPSEMDYNFAQRR